MEDTKSKTKETGDFLSPVLGGKMYKTTISNGDQSVSGSGPTSEESQKNASDRWKDKP